MITSGVGVAVKERGGGVTKKKTNRKMDASFINRIRNCF